MSRHKEAPVIFARRALLPGGWAPNIRVSLTNGSIAAIEPGTAPDPGDVVVDTLLPALANLHSHSFQRAMAGLTEYRESGRDSFWSWRELMYRFAALLTPDQIEAIAAYAFMEMQEAGFAAVAEFHYLHHQPGGGTYANRAELSQRIMAAAATTGIGLTHLPVLYSYGGAGRVPLAERQRRFGTSVDEFARLVEESRDALRSLPADAGLGIAPHSLRATSPEDLERVLPLAGGGPVHLHIAEQPQEVADIRAWFGARPVEWLLGHAPVGPAWCLIHATHMTPEESSRLAATGAVAGLCPLTEANLGDGPFGGPDWFAARGRFGVGSDSNIRISVVEELRQLEYSQRLRDLSRNVLGEGSVGASLYVAAAKGGAQALGRAAGSIAVGQAGDLVAINSEDPALAALPEDRLLDGWVFAGGNRLVTDLWSAGRHMVRGGRHLAREAIVRSWRKAVRDIISAL
jgi:formiminoglutamate deiminase